MCWESKCQKPARQGGPIWQRGIIRVIRKSQHNSIAVLIALPLAIVLWQGSSCRSGNSNASNTSMNANKVVTTTQKQDLRGTWGGDHIAMEVTDEGAQLEFDCANGRITEKIAPDADGKFEAEGVYTRERPGPTRMGEDNEQPATYRGSIKDKTMTLTIELTRTHETVGTFTLTQGSTGRIRKCL